MKKADDKSPDEPKVQKLTVKRTSTDAWSSTTKSGHNKDRSLDALFNEFGADNSESGDEDMESNRDVTAESHPENAKQPPLKGKKSSAKTRGITNISNMDSPKVNGVKKKDIARFVLLIKSSV